MTTFARRFFASTLVLAAAGLPARAGADVQIETTPARDYVLPGAFDLNNAQVQRGAADATIISATIGTTPEEAACGVVIASDTEARLLEYRFAGAPTQCIGVLPHPAGGVFVRGSNPTAVDGEVTGFTSFVDGADQEAWAVTDETLVAANPEPTGTGEFQGTYVTAHGAMAYSPQLDKLLGFTIGKLVIGQDEKFLSQAHVVNADSGQLRVSGQTFGLSGVGVVGGTAVRADGEYLIYYYSSGDRGAFFYTYDGRTNVDFFNPRGEEWDDRFVLRMIYANDLLHLLWTPSDGESVETRVTATTDTGAELWSATLPPEYTFANGEQVVLGMPVTMWVTAEHTAVLHQTVDGQLLLRVLDRNGESLGVARLAEVGDFPPFAIVNGPNDGLKLLTYDDANRHVYELGMTFVDVPDFDPDAGIPDGGFGDVGIPADIGLQDVLEAAGCCATTGGARDANGAWLAALAGLLLVRRRRRT